MSDGAPFLGWVYVDLHAWSFEEAQDILAQLAVQADKIRTERNGGVGSMHHTVVGSGVSRKSS